MPQAVIFDVDGTLVDSVDLHALAWQEALARFGHAVSFGQARGQIGKGGDKLIPVFLSQAEQADHGDALAEWRGEHFKSKYLHMVRPFAAVPDLLRRIREAGMKVAVASSAKSAELGLYLKVAAITDLVDVATSSEDVEQSKPAPDIFEVALAKLGVEGHDAVAVGDTPYDAESAGKAGISAIGVLSGGFTEEQLRGAGCVAVYPGPGGLLACFDSSPLGQGNQAATATEIYRSSNGDRWQLVRAEGAPTRRFVRHIAAMAAGGHVTDTDIGDFLAATGSRPEAVALKGLLASLPG